MHMNSLPSLVFRLIFSRLSLHDQLQVGRVCWLWKENQQDITRRVRSLTLLIGIEDHDDAQHLKLTKNFDPIFKPYRSPSDQIAQSPFTLPHCSELLNDRGDGPLFATQPNSGLRKVAYLNSSNVNLLVDSLTNVHTLNIAINEVHSHAMEHVIRLLRKLKDKLVTLKLWCNFSNAYLEVDISQSMALTLAKLFELLICLSTLDHLTLDFNNHFYDYSPIPDYDFAVLSRLSEFNFRSLDEYTKLPIYKWLKQCDVANTRLQRIGLDFDDVADDNILSLPSTLISKLTVIHQYTYFPDPEFDESKEQTRRYLNACPSLASLRFEHFLDLIELFNILTPFKQLIHLELDFYHTPSSVFGNFDRTPSHQIAQLSSVKLLTLKCEKHCNFNSRNWAWVFPNVQILRVEHNCFQPTGRTLFRCYNPSEYKGKWTAESLNLLVSGVHDLLATFKQMAKLRRIYLNDYDKDYKGKFDLVKFDFTF